MHHKSKIFFDDNLEEADHLNFKEKIETSLKKLSVLHEEVITQIKKCFQTIGSIPQNFYQYNMNTATYSNFQRLYDELFLDFNEQKELGKNQKFEELIQDLNIITLIFKKQYEQSQTKFIQNCLYDPNLQFKIFNDVEMTEDKIKKQYRELSAIFHPDKSCQWLEDCNKNEGRTFFTKIVQIKEQFLEKIGANSNFSALEEKAQPYWSLSLDYKNGMKKNWDKLRVLEKNHILSDDELNKMNIYYEREHMKNIDLVAALWTNRRI